MERDDRKYFVKVHGSGRVISRNRRFLKPVSLPDVNHEVIISSDLPREDVNHDLPNTSEHGLSTSIIPNGAEAGLADPAVPSANGDANEERVPRNSPQKTKRLPRMFTQILPHNNPGLKE